VAVRLVANKARPDYPEQTAQREQMALTVPMAPMVAMAQMESDMISERIRAAYDYKREQGINYRRAPIGWRYDKSQHPWRIYRVPDEQAVIEQMLKLKTEERSFGQVAKILNEEGVARLRPRTLDTPWNANTVLRLLRDFPRMKHVKDGGPIPDRLLIGAED
jgi:hypothetical protein